MKHTTGFCKQYLPGQKQHQGCTQEERVSMCVGLKGGSTHTQTPTPVGSKQDHHRAQYLVILGPKHTLDLFCSTGLYQIGSLNLLLYTHGLPTQRFEYIHTEALCSGNMPWGRTKTCKAFTQQLQVSNCQMPTSCYTTQLPIGFTQGNKFIKDLIWTIAILAWAQLL